jgi:hypothetical protein
MNVTRTFQMSRSDNVKVAVGFSPRIFGNQRVRRAATLERAGHFKRGYATQSFVLLSRGLKPTATLIGSLRERFAIFALRLCASAVK